MKKSIAFIAATLMFASMCACGETKTTEKESDYIYGQISSISGNDIKLLIAEYTKSGSDDDSADNDKSSAVKEGKSADSSGRGGLEGKIPKGDFDPENMPEGGFDRDKMPEGGFDPENMPEGGFNPENMPEGGFNRENMPEGGFDRENMPDDIKPSGKGRNNGYTLTGEEKEIRIPAGVTVTTALGVETDFDVLETGDMIKCSVKTDNNGNQTIIAVWIVE